MVMLCMDLFGVYDLCNGDYEEILKAAVRVEEVGIDQLCVGDHVVMGEDTRRYPFGEWPVGPDYHWVEPLTMFAAVAARTSRIRLCTGVVLAPLRPTVLLAKQAATLDVISNGRLDLGIGTGWQMLEYDACNISYASRVSLLREQAAALKAIWSDAPVNFEGAHHHLSGFYSYPQPIQRGGVPLWFGVPPSTANVELIAELGAGWMPLGISLDQTAATVAALRSAFAAHGRDPEELQVLHVPTLHTDGRGQLDFDRTFDEFEEWLAIGVTVLRFSLFPFCAHVSDISGLLQRMVSWRDSRSKS